ncbi:hypothetical protein E5Q_05181 [Mixia osmundae IAM 14324]|uniref:Uncharacterized protein n=2 Tax=Mixia osmundae (strain CBS 9802 / IAM 14324 / JCM 22182 / KY 12970) TaxID=764103 RepID=G7E6N5_MIXOS|nr:hypothetical protein E5Q_05181 [Mixia osmundae IAM 14324]
MISLKPNHPTLKRGATCQESPKGRSVKCRAQLLQGDPSHAVYEVSQRMTMTLLPNPIAPAWPILQRCCRVYHEVIVHVGLTDRDFRYDDQKARWSCDYDEIFYRKKDEGERGECAKLIPQKGNGACPIRSPQPVFELATTYSGCKTPPPAPQIA